MKILCILLILTGCALGPRYKRPDVAMPSSFECNANTNEPWVCWWRQLGDPLLDSLIERTVACNLDLKKAEAAAQKARGKYIMTQALLWPYINAVFNPARWELSNNFPFVTVAQNFNTFDFAFDATWEIDIFGKNHRLSQSRYAAYEAHVEYSRNVMITLIAEMARTYINLRSYQAQLANARQIENIQNSLLCLVQNKYQQNLASEIDLENAKKEIYKTQASITVLEQAILESVNGIALIVSELPGDLECELCQPMSLPALPDCLPVGLPSDLLCRRPDIREAERKLEAAVAEVGYSVADFFPQFDLTANVGFFSTKFGSLFNNGNQNQIYAGNILFPLFRGGELVGQYKAAKAEQCEALYNYVNVVLTAFHDVDNALTAYRHEKERYTALHEAVNTQQVIGTKVLALEEQGLVAQKELLENQLALIALENDEVQSHAKRVINFISLYKALGGGWSPDCFCD